MKDVIDSIKGWRASSEQIAVATVINTWGSAPRPVGSKLSCTASGLLAGSVSAGCVEGAVVEEAMEALELGRPRVLDYGVADEDAWEVGLACGGSIQILVEPLDHWDAVYEGVRQRIDSRTPMAVVSVLHKEGQLHTHEKLIVELDGTTEGTLHMGDAHEQMIESAIAMTQDGHSGVVQLDDDTDLFVEVYPPTPRLVIIGAVHIADYLVHMAKAAGFDTYVIDPRAAFATAERFPHTNYLIKEWPAKTLPEMNLDSSAYVVVLTHDPKLDDPSLQYALKSKARYIGALGSRKTNEKRRQRLREAGLSEEQIARLHAPIGLNLGGRSPQEIAVSILAELVQVKNQKSS